MSRESPSFLSSLIEINLQMQLKGLIYGYTTINIAVKTESEEG
jgi:hypothetical protein